MRIVQLALAGALMTALAACSNDASRPQVATGLVKNLSARLKAETPAPAATAAQIRAAITPELRAANSNQPLLIATSTRLPISSLMVMSGKNGDVRTYLTPDGISFSLRNGILVASRGLGEDLMSADVSQVLARVRAGSGQAVRGHRYLDGENHVFIRSFNCTYARSGREVVESCTGEDASFQNRYVLNRAGKIIESVQWVSPKLESYRLEDLG